MISAALVPVVAEDVACQFVKAKQTFQSTCPAPPGRSIMALPTGDHVTNQNTASSDSSIISSPVR